jgi:N-acetylglucosamine-6-phosphate deacetylase
MILKNAKVLNDKFVFEKSDIEICGKLIKSVRKISASENNILDCSGKIIIPGLVDIHTHGCIGFDSSDKLSLDSINRMSKFYAQNGTTTYLPTIESNTPEDTLLAVKNICSAEKNGVSGASIGGIHLEGPYFSEKYKGAQNINCLRLPDINEFLNLCKESDNTIRLISLAPELPGAIDFIAKASQVCSVAMGHTDSDYASAVNAISAGVTVMTHTFNAMRPLHHRAPNAVGAALDSNIFCEFICDGFHIDKTIIRIMYKLLSDERMLFISDSVRAAGMPDGRYTLANLPFFVKNGEARLEDGTIAGSTTTLFKCAVNAISFGIPPESAFKMASITPAKACGIDSVCGSITPGKRADILILDQNFNIEKVIIRGNLFEKGLV